MIHDILERTPKQNLAAVSETMEKLRGGREVFCQHGVRKIENER